MIAVLEFKVELLSNHRWRVSDSEGRSLMAEKVIEVGNAVLNLLDMRVSEQLRAREIRLAENLRCLVPDVEPALISGGELP